MSLSKKNKVKTPPKIELQYHTIYQDPPTCLFAIESGRVEHTSHIFNIAHVTTLRKGLLPLEFPFYYVHLLPSAKAGTDIQR
jgi:hypothetical protein